MMYLQLPYGRVYVTDDDDMGLKWGRVEGNVEDVLALLEEDYPPRWHPETLDYVPDLARAAAIDAANIYEGAAAIEGPPDHPPDPEGTVA